MLSYLGSSRVVISVLLCSLIFAQAGNAKVIEGAHFTPRLAIGSTNMVLYGAGISRYLRVYKVSAAALYLAEGVTAEQVLQDIPKRLEIEYFYPVKAKDFALLTKKWISANADSGTWAHLRPKVDRFNSLYQDVRPGDRYSLTYIPGQGTELALNGNRKGIMEGADFASALFSIWLGHRPLNKELKAALLGKS